MVSFVQRFGPVPDGASSPRFMMAEGEGVCGRPPVQAGGPLRHVQRETKSRDCGL